MPRSAAEKLRDVLDALADRLIESLVPAPESRPVRLRIEDRRK